MTETIRGMPVLARKGHFVLVDRLAMIGTPTADRYVVARHYRPADTEWDGGQYFRTLAEAQKSFDERAEWGAK